MGVVVRRHIDFLIIITYSYNYTPIIALFCSSIPTSLFIFKMFFVLVYTIFVQIRSGLDDNC